MPFSGRYQNIAANISDVTPGTINIVNITGGPGIVKDINLTYIESAFTGTTVTTEIIIDGVTVYTDSSGDIIAQAGALLAKLTGVAVADLADDQESYQAKVIKYAVGATVAFAWKVDLAFQTSFVLRHTFGVAGGGGNIVVTGISRYMIEV